MDSAKALSYTTDSAHNLPVFPNLARGVVPDGPNQVWNGDITYVALVLDAWCCLSL